MLDGSPPNLRSCVDYASVVGMWVSLNCRPGEARPTPEQGVHPGQFDGAYFHISGGPLLVQGKVIVGVSLGIDAGGGGSFDAGSRSVTPKIVDPAAGTTLWVFKSLDPSTAAMP